MATRFSVSGMEIDDDTLSRKCDVRVGTSGDVRFQTPLKAGLGSVTELPFYEAYKRVRPETIAKCLESEDADRKQGRDLRSRCKGGFNVLTLEYGGRAAPDERAVTALSDMQYNNTDAVTTPSWFDAISQRSSVDVDLYIRLSQIYVEASSVRNRKPMIGTIPQCIPPAKLEAVVKSFIDSDITSFAVDSYGRTLISGSWIRALMRCLEPYRIGKEGILYSINAFQGIARKTEDAIEAKDFVGFAMGFDVIGGKHTSKRHPRNAGGDASTVGRLFDRSTYNYSKRVCMPEQKKRIDDESVRRQSVEFSNVRDAIAERSVKSLLESKALTRETMGAILYFRGGGGMTRLDDFV